jgi:hypothetical protein
MSNEPEAGMGIDPEMLAAYIDQRLSPEQRAAVEAQLAKDPDSYAVLVETLKALDDESIKALPVKERTGEVRKFEPKQKPAMGRRVITGLLAMAAAIALVMWTMPDLRKRLGGERGSPQLERLVAAVGEERYVEGRLSGGFRFGPLRTATRGAAGSRNPSVVALDAELQGDGASDSAARLHLLGLTKLLVGDLDSAVSLLMRASQRDSMNASMSSDLAAAYIARFRRDGATDDLRRALDAASQSVERAPELSEAAFNRALAAELLGSELARDYWRNAVSITGDPDWKAEAERRLAAIEGR